jgi:hypothetical protein
MGDEAVNDPLEHLGLARVQLPVGIGDDGDAIGLADMTGPDALGGAFAGADIGAPVTPHVAR